MTDPSKMVMVGKYAGYSAAVMSGSLGEPCSKSHVPTIC
jgi:hypothetical protein